jgi:HEAT repeat protein
MTLDEVRALIDPDEPDYARAAAVVSDDDVAHLATLAAGDDVMLASKAVYLAGLVGGDEAAAVVRQAADHDDPTVRVSAAAAIKNLPDAPAMEVGRHLLRDDDVGVRKVVLQSAARLESAQVRADLLDSAADEDDPYLRELAARLG